MKQLSDFDLSIVMPFYKSLEEFKHVFPARARYFERNGIEVIIVADEPAEQQGIIDYIRTYPFICWKIVVNGQDHGLRNPAKVYNVGIRQSTKRYVMVLDLKLEFYTDVIYWLRKKLDSYPEHYALGQILCMDSREEIKEQMVDEYPSEWIRYGAIMAKKEYFERISGYDENYPEWGCMDDYLQKRLQLAGIHRLFFPEAIFICRKDFPLRPVIPEEPQTRIPDDVLSEMLLPVHTQVNSADWGYDFDTVVYDWKDHLYAKEACRNYLSTLKQYEIVSDSVFDKSYPLIALIPTYNESERITDCLRSIEKYCDGIILLDDDSTDGTYQMVQSNKLLVKAKKVRKEFNDKQNRNILLDIASFFKAEWFIFIDADERFDDRFVDLRAVMKLPVDIVGVWIANLWDSMETYRTDMVDSNPHSKNGLWFRWRMFRNKGRMQLLTSNKLHFNAVPYVKNVWNSRTLLLHAGYLHGENRKNKYLFYKKEDARNLLDYKDILKRDFSIDLVNKIDVDSINIINDVYT